MSVNAKQKGQYFTECDYLRDCVLKLINNSPEYILEPSCGRGHLVEYIQKSNSNIKFDLYEIDHTLQLLESVKHMQINYCDFLKANIYKKYDTIVGNPPYVKTSSGNLYLQFIDKCFELLEYNGELIFIVPSDFMKITSSSPIINKLMNIGTFTHVFRPNKENLFKSANVDVILFRYCKNHHLDKNIIHVNNVEKHLINTNGILTYNSNVTNKNMIKQYFNIYVGIVSGKEDVFKTEIGNVNILNEYDKSERYILIDKFPSQDNNINTYLLNNKTKLLARKIRKFNENNWWQWGALRNYNTIINNKDKDCIYINTLSRKKKIAFTGKVTLFGGNLLIMIPIININLDILEKIVDYMNDIEFQENYMYAGRFKITHRQLEHSYINLKLLDNY